MVDFIETVVLDSNVLRDKNTKLRQTTDGYMICMPRIARTGIQEYRGIEVGRPDLEVVRVYRPESEVFSHDAVRTLAGRPVTIEHPEVPVNASNWRDFAVGHIGEDVMRDGEFIRVPLIVMDAKAVNEVKSGRAQLSVGYSAVLEWADGVTPSGETYHAKQTSIRANHVAITHAARGGDKLRMGDKQETTMATRTITVMDGITVALEERDAQLVEKQLTTLEKQVKDAQTALAAAQTTAQTDSAKLQTEVATLTTQVQAKDAEIVTLKKQLDDSKITPQQLDALAASRAATMQRAKALLDSVVIEGKTDAEIKRQVVSARLGDVAKDWTDDMVTASFNTLTAPTGTQQNGNLHHVVEVLRHTDSSNVNDAVSKAYTDYNSDLTNRWKTAGGRTP